MLIKNTMTKSVWFIIAYGSRVKVHNGSRHIGAGGREITSPAANTKQKEQNGSWGESINSQRPPPVSGFPQQGSTSQRFHKFPQTQPPTGNPVFRYLSLWGGILIQTTTDTYLEICQEKVKPHQWLNSTNYNALEIPLRGGPVFLALGWISWCRWVRMGEGNWLSLHSGQRRSKPQQTRRVFLPWEIVLPRAIQLVCELPITIQLVCKPTVLPQSVEADFPLDSERSLGHLSPCGQCGQWPLNRSDYSSGLG